MGSLHLLKASYSKMTYFADCFSALNLQWIIVNCPIDQWTFPTQFRLHWKAKCCHAQNNFYLKKRQHDIFKIVVHPAVGWTCYISSQLYKRASIKCNLRTWNTWNGFVSILSMEFVQSGFGQG